MTEAIAQAPLQTLEPGCVPVTDKFLSLVSILQLSRRVFIHEEALAEAFGEPRKEYNLDRCSELFYKKYAAYADAIGLHRNAITLQSILHLEISNEINSTSYDILENTYYFNPWAFQGRGGICRFQGAEKG